MWTDMVVIFLLPLRAPSLSLFRCLSLSVSLSLCLSLCPAPSSSELIRTPDGGQISLDWVDNGVSDAYPEAPSRPTVLILPGLTGNSQQTYVLHAVSQAVRRGYRSGAARPPHLLL